MLKSEKMVVNYVGIKNNESMPLVRDYVVSVVRHQELATAKKKISTLRKKVEDLNPGVDGLTCDLAIITKSLSPVDADKFVKSRKDYLELVEECNKCIALDGLTAYPESDVARIRIMAHMIYSSVNLENVLENIDLGTPIKEWYTKKQGDGKIKDILATVFTRLLKTEGDLFYGVRVKRSQFDDEDVKNFIAIFGGKANRTVTTTKDKEGNKVKNTSPYGWTYNTGSKALQYSALTTLLAVILDNPSKHVVIKPDEKSAQSETTK